MKFVQLVGLWTANRLFIFWSCLDYEFVFTIFIVAGGISTDSLVELSLT